MQTLHKYKINETYLYIYSEKQLKDIKIMSYFLKSRKYIPTEISIHLIVLSIRNFRM